MKLLARLPFTRRFRPELIALIVAAAATRLWSLFTPNAIVFDEVYFKAFAAHYFDHRYYFDIHPPLGKLLLAGVAHLAHLSPDSMLDSTALPLRILPATAGALLIPLVWGILRRLGASRPFAFLGAFLVLADNALLVESRFILMDSMLLLFGLSALYFYLIARSTTSRLHWLWLSLSAAAAGAALSIKWTGLSALGLIGIVWLWDQRGRRASLIKRAAELALLGLIPLTIYFATFWVHFKLLTHSGDGDAFMPPSFQATLIDSSYYDPHKPLRFLYKFEQLNIEMYQANKTLTATHPYGSRWYTWPFELRPIYYWEGDVRGDGSQGNIYLLGNPVIWWGIWIAIIAGLGYTWLERRKLRPRTITALCIAGVAYAINLIPFVAVARVMFLYHYFFSFIFSLIFVVMLWQDLATDEHDRRLIQKDHRRIFAGLLIIIALGFAFFAPLSYGTPLSPAGLQAHMWLHSWR